MNNFEILQNLFREIFNASSINILSSMQTGDLPGWDSFKNVEIILACEKKFNIRFRSKEIDAMRTVGDLVKAIELKLASTHK